MSTTLNCYSRKQPPLPSLPFPPSFNGSCGEHWEKRLCFKKGKVLWSFKFEAVLPNCLQGYTTMFLQMESPPLKKKRKRKEKERERKRTCDSFLLICPMIFFRNERKNAYIVQRSLCKNSEQFQKNVYMYQ